MSPISASSPGYIIVPSMVHGRPQPLRQAHCRHPALPPQPSYHDLATIGCRLSHDNDHHAHQPIQTGPRTSHASIANFHSARRDIKRLHGSSAPQTGAFCNFNESKRFRKETLSKLLLGHYRYLSLYHSNLQFIPA